MQSHIARLLDWLMVVNPTSPCPRWGMVELHQRLRLQRGGHASSSSFVEMHTRRVTHTTAPTRPQS